MRIYIENLINKTFYAGKGRWTENPDEAYAFPNAVAAMNFYMEQEQKEEPGSFIMRFGSADAKKGMKPKTHDLPRLISSVY